MLRIHKLFDLERAWVDLPPQRRHERRQLASRPILDDFFAWAKTGYERVKGARGLVASAFGYAVRHEGALRRFLDDIPLTMSRIAPLAARDGVKVRYMPVIAPVDIIAAKGN